MGNHREKGVGTGDTNTGRCKCVCARVCRCEYTCGDLCPCGCAQASVSVYAHKCARGKVGREEAREQSRDRKPQEVGAHCAHRPLSWHLTGWWPPNRSHGSQVPHGPGGPVPTLPPPSRPPHLHQPALQASSPPTPGPWGAQSPRGRASPLPGTRGFPACFFRPGDVSCFSSVQPKNLPGLHLSNRRGLWGPVPLASFHPASEQPGLVLPLDHRDAGDRPLQEGVRLQILPLTRRALGCGQCFQLRQPGLELSPVAPEGLKDPERPAGAPLWDLHPELCHGSDTSTKEQRADLAPEAPAGPSPLGRPRVLAATQGTAPLKVRKFSQGEPPESEAWLHPWRPTCPGTPGGVRGITAQFRVL